MGHAKILRQTLPAALRGSRAQQLLQFPSRAAPMIVVAREFSAELGCEIESLRRRRIRNRIFGVPGAEGLLRLFQSLRKDAIGQDAHYRHPKLFILSGL